MLVSAEYLLIELTFYYYRFPTIYFVPKGRNSRPIKFEDNRSIDNLISFMQTHSKEELKFVEPEEKYLKKPDEADEAVDESAGTCSGNAGEGQCSAGKSEL